MISKKNGCDVILFSDIKMSREVFDDMKLLTPLNLSDPINIEDYFDTRPSSDLINYKNIPKESDYQEDNLSDQDMSFIKSKMSPGMIVTTGDIIYLNGYIKHKNINITTTGEYIKLLEKMIRWNEKNNLNIFTYMKSYSEM